MKTAVSEDQQCVSFGFKPGTDGYAQCRLAMAQDRADANERKRVAAAAALGQMSNYYNQQALEQRQMRTTNCNVYGNSMNCTSF